MVLLRERSRRIYAVIVSLMTVIIPGLILFAPTMVLATPPIQITGGSFLQLAH